MSTVTHTQNCIEASSRTDAEQLAYTTLWPNYCKTCDGWGGVHSSYDPSPSGVSLGSGSMQEFDPCTVCTEVGKCPRCGQDGITSEDRGDAATGEGPCKLCGWDYDGGLPQGHECGCWDQPFDYAPALYARDDDPFEG